MRHTSEVRRLFERAPGAIAVAHQHALVAVEECLRIFLAAPGLIVEQHDRLEAVFGTTIAPHITFALRRFAGLLEYLERCFVTMDQRLRQQRFVKRIIQPAIVPFARPYDPVRERAASNRYVRARKHVFHSVQWRAVDVFPHSDTVAIIVGLAWLPGSGCAGIGARTIGVGSAWCSQCRQAYLKRTFCSTVTLTSMCNCSLTSSPIRCIRLSQLGQSGIRQLG